MSKSSPSGALRDELETQILDEKYRVERFLKQGGFGRVYKARHIKTHTLVALKFLLPNEKGGYSRHEIDRFVFEAEAPASIGRGVIKCLDYYPSLRDRPCLVTEFIDGHSLEDILRVQDAGRLTLLSTLHIATQLAATMSIAHQQAIVHRDLTPKNLLLPDWEPDPSQVRVKIIDWGIARKFEERLSTEQLTTSAPPGPFVPPEGAGVIHPPSDVYALGVLLYRMLLGSFPEPATHADPRGDHPGLMAQNEIAIPARIRRLISRCIALSPADRPPMEEARRALDKALASEQEAPLRLLEENLKARENQLQLLDGKLQILTRQEKEKDTRLEAGAQRIAHLERDLNALSQQAQKWQHQHNELQAARVALEQNQVGLLRDAEKNQRIIQEQQQQQARREQEVARELGDCRQRAEQLKQELVQATARADRAHGDADAKSRELGTLRRELHERSQAQQTLKDTLRTAEARLSIAEERVLEMEQLVLHLKTENARLVQEYTKAEGKLHEMRQRAGASQDDLRPLQDLVAQHKHDIQLKAQDLQLQQERAHAYLRGIRWRNRALVALSLVTFLVALATWKQLWRSPPSSMEAYRYAAVADMTVARADLLSGPTTVPAGLATAVAERTARLVAPENRTVGHDMAVPVSPPSVGHSVPAAPIEIRFMEISMSGVSEREKLRLFDIWPGVTRDQVLIAGARCVEKCGERDESTRTLVLKSMDQGRSFAPLPELLRNPPAGLLYRGITRAAGDLLIVGDGAVYQVANGTLRRIPIFRPGSRATEVLRGLFLDPQRETDRVLVASANPGGQLFASDFTPQSLPLSQKLPTGDSLYSIWGDARALWAVGTGGTLLTQERKTGRWNRIGAKPIGPSSPRPSDIAAEKLYQVSGHQDHIVACGSLEQVDIRKSGVLYQSRDGGRSFTRHMMPQPCYALVALADGTFVLGGIGDHLTKLSPDGALEPWAVPQLSRTANIKGLWGDALDHLFIVGWNGLAVRSSPN